MKKLFNYILTLTIFLNRTCAGTGEAPYPKTDQEKNGYLASTGSHDSESPLTRLQRVGMLEGTWGPQEEGLHEVQEIANRRYEIERSRVRMLNLGANTSLGFKSLALLFVVSRSALQN